MEGIRLRSDSTGSAKSAFYKGTIVHKNGGNDDAGDANSRHLRTSGKRDANRRKDKKVPLLPKKDVGYSDHMNPIQAVSPGVQDLSDFHGDLMSPSPVSPFAPPGGYYCQNGQSYDFQGNRVTPEFPTGRGGAFFRSLGTISDRSGQSLNDGIEADFRPNGPSWMDTWMAGMNSSSPPGPSTFLDESPSMDEAELKGVSLDLETSPVPSPTKRSIFLRNDGGFSSSGKVAYQLPPAPYPSGGSYARNNKPHGGNTLFWLSSLKSFRDAFHLSDWLIADVNLDEDGNPLPEEVWSPAALVRLMLYNPMYPEFTSLQQFSWAVILGILMGILTAVWKTLIELCVEFVWKTVPVRLFSWGFFTDLDGMFPIYHYMWITPGIFGGVLSYIFAALPTPIPGQNDWIHSLHSRGVQNSDTFGLLFLLSTAGMASGLSLGPELPLILTSGMIGSWIGVLCKQSILSARVLNLTAASAAIAGFFGFPMAGALFVLEVPHRMGLQYFEALSPATIASIVAVLTNRLATGNDVTGYYEYPFLNETLPSSIFHDAIVFGLFGGLVGIIYTNVVLSLKARVHGLFHKHEDEGQEGKKQDETHVTESTTETTPLVFGVDSFGMEKMAGIPKSASDVRAFDFVIAHEPTRAGVVGIIIGVVVGITCVFFPHVMFWGESQLQTLIDKGRTPLPVFGHGDEPTAGLVALGYCMVDHQKEGDIKVGFSIGCSAAIGIAKIFVTGLSLGTGIVGGHFWAPMFVGCTASHFLTDSVAQLSSWLGTSMSLSAYPCVALLCIMGSCHVVTFRAHIGIILILTLTIDAFDPEDGVVGALRVAGDYSAVFPLLTVAVFVALQISRHTIFYEKQRSRGDIMALPEVLCEPGKEGRPLVMDYEGSLHELDECDYDCEDGDGDDECSEESPIKFRTVYGGTTQREIEAQFNAQVERAGMAHDVSYETWVDSSTELPSQVPSPFPPRPQDRKSVHSLPSGGRNSPTLAGYIDNRLKGQVGSAMASAPAQAESSTADDFLGIPTQSELPRTRKTHRRTRSEPFHDSVSMTAVWTSTAKSPLERNNPTPVNLKMPVSLKRVCSFGQVDQEQPSLLDQARRRAASYASAEKPKKTQPKGIPSPRTEQRKSAPA